MMRSDSSNSDSVRPSVSAYDCDFWFSQGHKRSYDSAYDCDCDSVTSEDQPLRDSAYDSDFDSIASENQPIEGVPFPFIFRYFIFPFSSPLFFSPAKEAKNADNYDNTNEKKKGARKVFGKYMKTIQAEFSILSFQNFRL